MTEAISFNKLGTNIYRTYEDLTDLRIGLSINSDFLTLSQATLLTMKGLCCTLLCAACSVHTLYAPPPSKGVNRCEDSETLLRQVE